MRVIHSLNTVVLQRTVGVAGEWYWVISALWPFRLTDGAPVSAIDYWQAMEPVLQAGWQPDAGMPRIRAEVLVHGSCYPASGAEACVAHAGLRIGSIHKDLIVHGDRHWRFLFGHTKPLPFASMPLTHEYAFGGSGYADNPIGRGFVRQEQSDGKWKRMLPNVEYPRETVVGRDDCPRPAALDRLGAEWRPRARFIGPIRAERLDQLLSLPPGTDWACFNEAPEDQRMDHWFAGDEPWEIIGMHPHHRKLSGSLPGVRGRAFLIEQDESGQASGLDEVALNPDTVWFFPDREIGLVIHRGYRQVRDERAEELGDVLVAHEGLADDPRSRSHYLDQYRRRTGAGLDGAVQQLDTSGLIPANVPDAMAALVEQGVRGPESRDIRRGFDEALAEKAAGDEMDRAVAGADEVARSLGSEIPQTVEEVPHPLQQELDTLLDVLSQASTEPTRLARIPGGLEQMLERINELTEQVQADTNTEAEETTRQMIADLRAGLVGADADTANMMQEAIDQLESAVASAGGPAPLPRVDLEALRVQLQANARQLQAEHATLDAAFGRGELDAETHADAIRQITEIGSQLTGMESDLEATGASFHNQYRQSAHMLGEAGSPHPGEEAERCAQALDRLRAGMGCANGDYAFCDFSGLDLRGADFSNCLLEYVNLSGADLSQACLDGAILAGAHLHGVKMHGTSLQGANLGRVEIVDCQLHGCHVDGTILGQAFIRDSEFRDCDFGDAEPNAFTGARLDDSRFERCRQVNMQMLQMGIRNTAWIDSDLSGTNWLETTLAAPDFRGSNLAGANFIDCDLSGAGFDRTALDNTRFLSGSTLTGARFRGARGDRTMFRGASMNEIDATGARFVESDFSEASLEHAILDRVDLARSRMDHACLAEARVRGANLMDVSLYRADLRATDFQGSSLYRANFLHVTLTRQTDLGGTHLAGTLLENWRPTR